MSRRFEWCPFVLQIHVMYLMTYLNLKTFCVWYIYALTSTWARQRDNIIQFFILILTLPLPFEHNNTLDIGRVISLNQLKISNLLTSLEIRKEVISSFLIFCHRQLQYAEFVSQYLSGLLIVGHYVMELQLGIYR